MESRDKIAIYLLLAYYFSFCRFRGGRSEKEWMDILSSLLIFSIRGDLYYFRSNKEKTTYVLVKKEF